MTPHARRRCTTHNVLIAASAVFVLMFRLVSCTLEDGTVTGTEVEIETETCGGEMEMTTHESWETEAEIVGDERDTEEDEMETLSLEDRILEALISIREGKEFSGLDKHSQEDLRWFCHSVSWFLFLKPSVLSLADWAFFITSFVGDQNWAAFMTISPKAWEVTKLPTSAAIQDFSSSACPFLEEGYVGTSDMQSGVRAQRRNYRAGTCIAFHWGEYHHSGKYKPVMAVDYSAKFHGNMYCVAD
ncbi:hypothetical protein Pelo_14494 [Pelomyxa schiedti]|nr:hypothetical protein Pelo_14494 [Pelomyxa schiedti]